MTANPRATVTCGTQDSPERGARALSELMTGELSEVAYPHFPVVMNSSGMHFSLFYIGERVFHLDRAHIQTLMYLKLSVAGHLTIFLTRTRSPFWSIRPARILWIAVLGTQAVATLIAVYGLFMTPLGWDWAGFVWGYALAWFLVNDRVKLLAYRIFDPIKAAPKPEAEPKLEAEPQPAAKV